MLIVSFVGRDPRRKSRLLTNVYCHVAKYYAASRAVDIKQVGRDLDVRYVLEGSVRRAGDHVRITGQREVGFFIPEPVA